MAMINVWIYLFVWPAYLIAKTWEAEHKQRLRFQLPLRAPEIFEMLKYLKYLENNFYFTAG